MTTLVTGDSLAAALAMLPVWADEASPTGLWKNVDDASGKPRLSSVG